MAWAARVLEGAPLGKEPSNDDEQPVADTWRWILRVPRAVFLLIAVVVAVGVGLLIRGGSDPAPSNRERATPEVSYRNTTQKTTIADLLPKDQQFAQFLVLVRTAGWIDRLADPTQTFTVLAPDSAAMTPEVLQQLAEDPDASAQRVVERHLVAGKFSFVELLSGTVPSLTAVDGTELKVVVDGATVTVDGVTVTKHDIDASNGVIHVVEGVGDLERSTTSSDR